LGILVPAWSDVRRPRDCTEPSGHRKHCTTGTFNEEDWEPDYPLVGMLTRENDAIVRESFDND